MATSRQAAYAKALLAQCGYSTLVVAREHLALGAGRRQLGWTVDSWLDSMTSRVCSQLIDDLRAQLDAKQQTIESECWATARPIRG